MIRRLLMALLCLVLLFTPGCWDLLIIEDLALAFALGIDADPEDPDMIRVSLTNPIFSEEADASTAKVIAKGNSLTQAFLNMQRQRDRQLVLGQTNILVFDEKLARSGGLSKIMREVDQQRDMNPNVLLAVIQGSPAQHVVYMEPVGEPRIALYMTNLMERNYNLGLVPHVTASRYWYRHLSPGIDPVVPVLEITGQGDDKKGLIITGLGAFDSDGRMTGVLTDNEIMYFLILTGQPRKARFTTKLDIEGKKHKTFCLIKSADVKVKTAVTNDIPKIAISINLDIDDVDIEWDADSLEDKTVQTLEQKLALDLKNNCLEVLKKTQSWQSDIAGLGRYVRVQHPRWFKGRDWGKDYEKCQITVELKVNIRRIGTLVKPLY